jgi:hypothetical protein
VTRAGCLNSAPQTSTCVRIAQKAGDGQGTPTSEISSWGSAQCGFHISRELLGVGGAVAGPMIHFFPGWCHPGLQEAEAQQRPHAFATQEKVCATETLQEKEVASRWTGTPDNGPTQSTVPRALLCVHTDSS